MRPRSDLEEHATYQEYVDMGFDDIYPRKVGRDRVPVIEAFGGKVLPNLKLG